MVTEDYVSFETAKLLKEKGFEGECHLSEVITETKHNDGSKWITETETEIKIPTIQVATKWLRKEKKLYINVWADPKDFENDDFSTVYRMHVYDGTSNYGTREFSEPEEAYEAGIRYCLENLI